MQADEPLLAVCRYVERNPLRAGLVARAEAWRWSGLYHRVQGSAAGLLDAGPLALPEGWLEHVNGVQSAVELERLRQAVRRGRPFGQSGWQMETAQRLGLAATLRPLGRPRKADPRP